MNTRMHDNGGNRDSGQPPHSTEVLIVALRRGRPEHSGETEGVLFLIEGDQVTEILDDGEELVFDASELRAALAG